MLAAVCLGGALVYVVASWKNARRAAIPAKIAASTSFVALALVHGAVGSVYGCTILAALMFSWIGDQLLLSRKSTFLLAGMAAFFAAHVGFSAAFLMRGVQAATFVISLVITGVFGVLILRWLWKYLDRPYRIAVPLYLGVVMIMVSTATAANGPSTLVAAGAAAFAISDISVARDRFIGRNVLNKAWGLPLYYAAQILFAVSVSTPA